MLRLLLFAALVLFPTTPSTGAGLRDTGMVCALDMGSNTFKFIVAEIKNGEYVQHVDIRKTAGVGDDVKMSEQKVGRRLISDEKLQFMKSMISAFQDECEKRTKSRKIHAIATAAFREAENGPSISTDLKKQDIDMRILTGEEESKYAYEAATSDASGFAVIDLGSRTTELVNRQEGSYRWAEIAIGYKIAWDSFYMDAKTFREASAQHLIRLKELIRDEEIAILLKQRELIAIEIGETSSYILGIPQSQIEGKVISRMQVRDKLNELLAMDAKSFAALKSDFKDGAKVLPRLVLMDFVLEKTAYGKFRGTDRELNVAILYRMSK